MHEEEKMSLLLLTVHSLPQAEKTTKNNNNKNYKNLSRHKDIHCIEDLCTFVCGISSVT